MTSENKVIKHAQGYVINRDPIRHMLIEKMTAFNECEKTILTEIRVHEADFKGLRISYLLAKLKTYVGLARVSNTLYPKRNGLIGSNKKSGCCLRILKN
jgi:hypothetical protein